MIFVAHNNPASITLFVICGITLILNIYGLIMMFKTDKSFSLEKYVLISGIVEVVLIILHNFILGDIFIDIIQALQILITLLISKKFLELYLIFKLSKKIKNTDNAENKEEIQQKGEEKGKHIYNSYFWILSVICVVLVILSFIIDFISENGSTIDVLVDFINDIICFIISIILFIFSIKIYNIMSELIIEQYKENQLIDIDEQDKNYFKKNEIFLLTRQKQILCISLGNLTTDLFEFALSLLEGYIFTVSPEDNKNKLSIYGLLNEYSLWLSTFLNYIAFYFIVKDSFNISYVQVNKNKKNEKIVITKTYIEKNKDEEEKETSDINKFLSENNDVKKNTKTFDEDF